VQNFRPLVSFRAGSSNSLAHWAFRQVLTIRRARLASVLQALEQYLIVSTRCALMSDVALQCGQVHSTRGRREAYGFKLKIAKWNERVGDLKGAPVVGEDGGVELGLISRGGLFRLARQAREDETGVAALHLFWQCLAWGTGNSHRNTPGRIASVAANEEHAALLLRDAGAIGRCRPESGLP
jgi:hypothetical protein